MKVILSDYHPLPVIRRAYFAKSILALAVCNMLGAVPALAEELPKDAVGWLASMRQARKTLDFTGKAALLRDSQVQMVTVEHSVANGEERECLHSLDDPGRELVRHAGKTTYFLPETQRSTLPEKAAATDGLAVLPEDLASYGRFYRFSLGEQQRLIGKSVQEVLIEPLDIYRYGRRFWVDVESRLPLKYQTLDGGKVLEQLVFSELNLNAEPSAAESGRQSASPAQEALPLESLQWRLERVPPGYRLVSYLRHTTQAGKPVEHLLLSDGLSSISLYIEENDGAVGLKKQVRHFGAMHLYIRAIGRFRITAMGEAPLAAVGLIGDSVQRME